jgi:hypothetical protein
MKDEEDLIPKYDDESSNEEIQDMIDTEWNVIICK